MEGGTGGRVVEGGQETLDILLHKESSRQNSENGANVTQSLVLQFIRDPEWLGTHKLWI